MAGSLFRLHLRALPISIEEQLPHLRFGQTLGIEVYATSAVTTANTFVFDQ